MKCPKCDYLGFETGDRCKNCGYNFSLMADAGDSRGPELLLREPEPAHRDADRWLNQLEARLDTVRPAAMSTAASDPLASMSLDAPVAAPPPAVVPLPVAPASVTAPVAADPAAGQRIAGRSTPALPLFHPGGADWDTPLIKVPATPRPPLAVRRTPERPKLRTVPKPVRKADADPESELVLAFAEEPVASAAPSRERTPRLMGPTAPASRSAPADVEVSGPARRLTAAVVDHLILLSIDAIVIYFTFEIAGLPLSAWRSIPMLPLALFLLMVKGSYFCVFTALGGQTVGKMATGIRVVADNHRAVEPSRAVQRTLASLVSFATIGIGLAPVLFASDRRALHDRVAGTRVVGPLHE
jgi:uncharacterized RDD family membrane protein YckC